MKLRTKLIIALCITFIVPALLFYICLQVMGIIQMSRLDEGFDMNVSYIQYETGLYEETVDQVTDTVWHNLEDTAESTPSRFLDVTYLNSLDAKLKDVQSYLVVTRNGEAVYGNPSDSVLEFAETVEPNEVASSWDGKQNLFVRGVSYVYGDGEYGVAYIVTDISDYAQRYWAAVVTIFIAVISTLVVTVAVLAITLYRSVYKPIAKLQTMTRQIADGNLDISVTPERNDEIGELFKDFEMMRRKLQESASNQIAEDAEGRVLISNISHDLKTPITSIKGYCEGILDGVADTPEKQDRYIHTIYNKANDMDRLIDELTYYSRINTNKIPYVFAKIDISEYFEDCVAEISEDLDAEGIAFEKVNDFEDQCVEVIADAEQLKKVINNIVGNAVKYMDKDEPKIIMRLLNQPDPDWVTMEIEDNGKGMAKEDLPRIFERFYRTDSARSSTTGGSGIGLSICRKIMNDHGGTIGVDSTLGQGTIMRFSLKKHKEDEHE